MDPKKLETLLRAAEREHAKYEKRLGKKDHNWPRWYANFLVKKLRKNEK